MYILICYQSFLLILLERIGILLLGWILTVDSLLFLFELLFSFQLFFSLTSNIRMKLSQLFEISSNIICLAFWQFENPHAFDIFFLLRLPFITFLFEPFAILFDILKPWSKEIRKDHGHQTKSTNNDRTPADSDDLMHCVNAEHVVWEFQCIDDVFAVWAYHQTVNGVWDNII